MKPVLFPEYDCVLGAPSNWEDADAGPCAGLPVEFEIAPSKRVLFIRSVWEFSDDERAAVAAGANLNMVTAGEVQPAVKLHFPGIKDPIEDAV